MACALQIAAGQPQEWVLFVCVTSPGAFVPPRKFPADRRVSAGLTRTGLCREWGQASLEPAPVPGMSSSLVFWVIENGLLLLLVMNP